MKKKQISWSNNEYEQDVLLREIGARSEAWMLDRKASVGPCYSPGLPFVGPSGITINLPKKSLRTENKPSGISINISRRCLMTKSEPNMDLLAKSSNISNSKKGKTEPKSSNYIGTFREKLYNVHSKIKGVFQ